jgi:dihydrofolate reductase
MQIVSLIAALDNQFAIGRGNALPWHLPDDLQRFKALTLNKTVVMGRKTAESLGRALPKRRNIVLSRSSNTPIPGMEVVNSLAGLMALRRDEAELCIIGGGEIYQLALPFATHLYLTHVNTAVENADAFFPRFDDSKWHITHREKHMADERHALAFEFVDYARAA